MQPDQARVVVADHHPLCRVGLANLLMTQVGFAHAVEASDFAHTLAALARDPAVVMVTVNFDLPDMKNVTGLRRLRADYPQARLVVVAESRARECVLEALCAGVHGYILKDTPPAEMVRAFDLIMAGHVYVPALVSDISDQRAVAATPAGKAALTERQLEVLRLVAAGRSNKQIARTLDIAEGTVKVHITAAFRALGVHNRVSAAAALQAQPRNDNAPAPVTPDLFDRLPIERLAQPASTVLRVEPAV